MRGSESKRERVRERQSERESESSLTSTGDIFGGKCESRKSALFISTKNLKTYFSFSLSLSFHKMLEN